MTHSSASDPQVLSSQSQWPHPSARIFISTGEVSGDLQGALLIEALQRQAAERRFNLEIVATGGDRMAAAGATLFANTSHIGSVGLVESLPFIWPTLRIQRRVQRLLATHPPDLVILIDYLGPNLTMGRYLRRQFPQVPMVYYIAPQEWVWSINSQKTSQIVGMTDRILAIFPEEARYYQKKGATVDWVGHPLIDWAHTTPSRETARQFLGIEPQQIAIALFPASRTQELKYLLPVMFAAAQQIQAQLPQVHFWIPLSLPDYRDAIERAIEHYNLRATIVSGSTAVAIAAADLAITKSGTVNLEIALLNVPQVVIYRVNPITAWIARHLLKFSIPFISPPNLVQMKPIVPELLQEQATSANIVRESLHILQNAERRGQILADYQEMRTQLGEVGVCDRAARAILQLLTPNFPPASV